MSNLQNEIGNMSAAEKFELLDVPWESIEADSIPPTNKQRAELDYRVSKYQRDPLDVVPWEQVKAGMFKKQ